MSIKLRAVRDGKEVPLPQGIENIVIETEQGAVYIQLDERIKNMVLMRATHADSSGTNGVRRLILSPYDSGRVAVGVIQVEA